MIIAIFIFKKSWKFERFSDLLVRFLESDCINLGKADTFESFNEKLNTKIFLFDEESGLTEYLENAKKNLVGMAGIVAEKSNQLSDHEIAPSPVLLILVFDFHSFFFHS